MMIGKTEEIMYPLQRLTLSPDVAERSNVVLHRQPSANANVELSNGETESATIEGTAVDFVHERHSDETDENSHKTST